MLTALAALVLAQTPINTLSDAEKGAGWKLLFDGTSTKGWRPWRGDKVGPGWKIENGVLTSADVEHAGDIVTEEKFEWFELVLDVNLGKGQNSGIMFRVTDADKEAPWHTGPEIQLYDHAPAENTEITGYLYMLYKPELTVNAAKPAGEWNTLRIVVAPDKCWTEVNGVKYYEYVIDSPDFWERVKKSKFNKYPEFAKSKTGYIGLQGDHGTVSYRNIKIRPIQP